MNLHILQFQQGTHVILKGCFLQMAIISVLKI